MAVSNARPLLQTVRASFVLELRRYLVYLKNSAIRLINIPAQVAAVYFLWTILMGDGSTAQREEMIRYYILAFVIRWLFTCRPVASSLETAIYEGGLVNFLVRPTSLLFFEAGKILSQFSINTVMLLVFLVPFELILGMQSRIDLAAVGWFLGLLAVGTILQFLLYALIGLCTFWTEKIFGLMYAFELTMLLTTGALLPLDFYPPALAQVLQTLPLSFFIYVPIEALSGGHAAAWGWSQLAVGGMWIAALLGSVWLLWRMGIKRFSGYGV